MYLPDNSTHITGISTIETDRVSRMYTDLYVLFGFMGFVVGCFILFITINISKAKFGKRNNAKLYTIDLPPRYSEVIPPSYDWVLNHCYHHDNCSLKMHTTLNLPTMMILSICLIFL